MQRIQQEIKRTNRKSVSALGFGSSSSRGLEFKPVKKVRSRNVYSTDKHKRNSSWAAKSMKLNNKPRIIFATPSKEMTNKWIEAI